MNIRSQNVYTVQYLGTFTHQNPNAEPGEYTLHLAANSPREALDEGENILTELMNWAIDRREATQGTHQIWYEFEGVHKHEYYLLEYVHES